MNYTTVDELQVRFGISRAKAIAILKQIAANGVGVFKAGRKGWPSRLESWAAR